MVIRQCLGSAGKERTVEGSAEAREEEGEGD